MSEIGKLVSYIEYLRRPAAAGKSDASQNTLVFVCVATAVWFYRTSFEED